MPTYPASSARRNPRPSTNASRWRAKWNRAAVGIGLLTHERFNIDLAYQLRYGSNVNHDFIRGVPGFEEDVFQHRVMLSTVIYFSRVYQVIA